MYLWSLFSEPVPYVSSFNRDIETIIIKRNILDNTHINPMIDTTNDENYTNSENYANKLNIIQEMNNEMFVNEFKLDKIFNNISLLNKEKRVIFSYLVYNHLNNITNCSLERKKLLKVN